MNLLTNGFRHFEGIYYQENSELPNKLLDYAEEKLMSGIFEFDFDDINQPLRAYKIIQ